ncbi:MAG: GrpB family protein [Rubrobacter sp.]
MASRLGSRSLLPPAASPDLAGSPGRVALRIELIGSIGVPGLPAKPVIGVLVSVADLGDEDAYGFPSESLG